MAYKLLVIGTSAGGINALKTLLPLLELPLGIPIIVVQHMAPNTRSYLPEIICNITGLPGVEASDKLTLEKDRIYVPSPNYHVLMEKDWTLSLSVGAKVSFARPSIDVLFETAADAVKDGLIGVLLTGANSDGADGLATIRSKGGYTLVQDPMEAEISAMPLAGVRTGPDAVCNLEGIAQRINTLMREGGQQT